MQTKDIIIDYLTRFNDMPTLQLARKIYHDYPHIFNNTEHVRSLIRTREGKNGNQMRGKVVDQKFYEREIVNTFNLPIPDYEDCTPYYMTGKNCLVLSDIHFPYHDLQALNTALAYGMEKEVDSILLNGDILDIYQFSKYVNNPSRMTVKEEIEIMRQFMTVLRTNFPAAEIVWKLGNHEERMARWLLNKARELYDWDEWRLEKLVDENQFHYTCVSDKRIVYVGDFPIGHGHEWNISNTTVFPARNLWFKSKESCAIGHVHKSSTYVGKTVNRTFQKVYTTGCLSQLYPEFARMNEWNHGFGHVRVTDNGTEFINLRIEEGVVHEC